MHLMSSRGHLPSLRSLQNQQHRMPRRVVKEEAKQMGRRTSSGKSSGGGKQQRKEQRQRAAETAAARAAERSAERAAAERAAARAAERERTRQRQAPNILLTFNDVSVMFLCFCFGALWFRLMRFMLCLNVWNCLKAPSPPKAKAAKVEDLLSEWNEQDLKDKLEEAQQY